MARSSKPKAHILDPFNKFNIVQFDFTMLSIKAVSDSIELNASIQNMDQFLSELENFQNLFDKKRNTGPTFNDEFTYIFIREVDEHGSGFISSFLDSEMEINETFQMPFLEPSPEEKFTPPIGLTFLRKKAIAGVLLLDDFQPGMQNPINIDIQKAEDFIEMFLDPIDFINLLIFCDQMDIPCYTTNEDSDPSGSLYIPIDIEDYLRGLLRFAEEANVPPIDFFKIYKN